MKHWTEEMFVDNPELFLILFDERPERVTTEVDALLKSLNGEGYQPQRILDMNCGIGRHDVGLAKRGIEVLGTDISPQYVEIAAKRAEEAGVSDRASFKVADMRRISAALKGEKPFDGIINLWTSFGFYNDDTNDDILRQCLKMVKPGGFFAIDIVNRDWLVRYFQPRGFQRIGDMTVLEDRTFNMNDSRMYNTWTFLKKTADDTYTLSKEIKLDHRVWSLHELIALFARTGWKYKAGYSGLAPGADLNAGMPLSSERDVLRAPRLLVISYRE
jgi:2-polyprenyl-3-methyl-5-hydroxy-6-metoxy-1,4-benzoquinol methylase